LTVEFGYGTYIFYLDSRADQLDKNVVLGLFVWDDLDDGSNHYREIDIEFARWGDAQNANSQYVVQPYQNSANMHRFHTTLTGDASVHAFVWSPTKIYFISAHGHQYPPAYSDIIESWSYTGSDIPSSGTEQPRINLWLWEGAPPSNGATAEAVVSAFEYRPDTSLPTQSPTPTVLPEPRILAAGYMTTDLEASQSGMLGIVCYTTFATGVELCYHGLGTGIMITNVAPEFWQMDIPLPGMTSSQLLLELRVRNGGREGPLWPYLTIGP
jgi:hypothetical protein